MSLQQARENKKKEEKEAQAAGEKFNEEQQKKICTTFTKYPEKQDTATSAPIVKGTKVTGVKKKLQFLQLLLQLKLKQLP